MVGLTPFLVNQGSGPVHSACPRSKEALPKVRIPLFSVIRFFASLWEKQSWKQVAMECVRVLLVCIAMW